MQRKTYLLLGLSALFCLHFIAAKLHLYWMFWWFDIFMHTFGGFLVGLLAASFLPAQKKYSQSFIFATAILGALSVGIAWEVFEYIIGFTFAQAEGYAFDTVTDLIMDLSGALVGYFFFLSKKTHV